jgi:M6 family metalloprotease-like protein
MKKAFIMKPKKLQIMRTALLMLCVSISVFLLPAILIQEPSEIGNIDIENDDIGNVVEGKNDDKKDGWTAPEDQFLKGMPGSKQEKYVQQSTATSDPTALNPTASYLAPKTMPSTIRLIVILVKFSDLANTLTKAQMQDKLFGSVNSVADYWNEVSFGTVTITGAVTDWLTLPNTREYYGRDNGEDTDSYYGPSSKFVTAAIDLANPVINYANYDKVMVVHAGNDQAQSGQDYDMWSHAYQPFWGPYWYRDSTYIYTSSCLAENEGIGTYCHEFGHQCDLPDLYDTVGSNNYVNNWCLMDSGSWNGAPSGSSPAQPTGYCKNFLGLIPANKIKTIEDTRSIIVTLDALETGGSNYLLAKIPLADVNQYYLVEARFLTGYDSALPGEGIIITKIDNTKWGGQGIVTVMDSRTATATKNDGEYDYESVEGEYGIFHDYTNNIHIIIKSQTTSSFTIMVDRKTIDRVNSWSMTRYTIGAQTIATFNIGVLIAGQRIAWEWMDDVGGSDNIDSWLELEGGTQFEAVEDYSHDSGVFQVATSGYYSFKIRNENLLFLTTYTFCWTGYNKFDLRIIFAEISANPVYEFNNFTVTATIQNWGDLTATGVLMGLFNEPDVGFQSGEPALKFSPNLAEWSIYSTIWKMTALSPNVDSYIAIYAGSSMGGYDYYPYNLDFELDILNDAILPQVTVLCPTMNEISRDSSAVMEWSGSDAESGLKQFKIFANGTLKSTLNPATDQYILYDLGLGYWNLTVQAIDWAGNKKNSSVMILIDTELPTINSFECNATWIRSNRVCLFSISAHDAYSKLNTVKLYRETTPDTWLLLETEVFTTESLSIPYQFGALSGTSVNYKAIVEDNAGNSMESTPIILSVDNTLPSVSIAEIRSESSNPNKHSGMLHLSISSSDAESGIASVQVLLNYTLVFGTTFIHGIALYNFSSGFYEYVYNTTNKIVDRNVIITVAVWDEAGNLKQVSQTIYVSNSADFGGIGPILPPNPIVLIIIIGACITVGGVGLVTVKKIKSFKQERETRDVIDFSDEEKHPARDTFGFSDLFANNNELPVSDVSNNEDTSESAPKIESKSSVFEF